MQFLIIEITDFFQNFRPRFARARMFFYLISNLEIFEHWKLEFSSQPAPHGPILCVGLIWRNQWADELRVVIRRFYISFVFSHCKNRRIRSIHSFSVFTILSSHTWIQFFCPPKFFRPLFGPLILYFLVTRLRHRVELLISNVG